jgi:transcriptional regulator with XRE-family HTH domain
MNFGNFLKLCRETHQITQDELAEALYLQDAELFAGVNSSTLSRWERGVSLPSLKRMEGVLTFFQGRARLPFPCLEENDPQRIEEILCEEPVRHLFDRQKSMVNRIEMKSDLFPSFQLVNLRRHEESDVLLELNTMLHLPVNSPYTQVPLEKFQSWLDHPANLFIAVSYRSSFLGLLFTLRLRPEAFQDILTFQRRKEELTARDFAPMDEEGSIYLLSFFAISPTIATMMFTRLFAHLLANQKVIREIGIITSFPDAQDLALKMNLRPTHRHRDGTETIYAYRNDPYRFFASDLGMKIFFPKQQCDS